MKESTVNILIVEDEAVLAMDLAETLTAEGYRVVATARNAAKALQLFREQPVDLLLCDIDLPGGPSGVDLVWQARKIRPVPVIYLTAYSDRETFNLAKQTGPSAYLPKPYQLPFLRNAIELAIYQESQRKTAELPEASGDEDETLNRQSILKLNGSIFIKQEYKFVKLALNELLFVEADGNYIRLQTNSRLYLLRMSMGNFLRKADSPDLVRVNRSFAVNLFHVDSFREQEVSVGQHTIALNPFFRTEFLSRFQIR